MQFFLPYLLWWCYVTLDNFLHVSWFICCQEWGILNPSFSLCSRDLFDQSTSSLELSWVIFNLKPSIGNVAICGAYHWSKFLLLFSAKEVFISSLISNKQLFPLVAEFRLNFGKFSISPLQTCVFRCWFSNNSIQSFFEGCFPSSFVAEIVIFFSAPLSQQSSFYSFVPEAVCCWFHQVSSHLVKFMFYSFHVQPECCPNSSSLILL